MATEQAAVRHVIATFLERVHKTPEALTDDLGLYGSGLELDSLEVAELSALLEDEFGSDPFSTAPDMPETVGDVLAFYPVAG